MLLLQLLREINHENVVKLVNVHINPADMSLYLAFDYAEHDLYVSILTSCENLVHREHVIFLFWEQSCTIYLGN